MATMPELTAQDRERFEKFVYAEPTTGCYLWGGAQKEWGHGHFGVQCDDGKWRPRSAHRVSWTLYRGQIPEDRLVLHRCPLGDEPSCVNPDHLYLGTPADNNADMARRWRGSTGSLPFGVHPQPSGGRFQARIKVAGESRYLGTYDTIQEAHEVAVNAKKEVYYGRV